MDQLFDAYYRLNVDVTEHPDLTESDKDRIFSDLAAIREALNKVAEYHQDLPPADQEEEGTLPQEKAKREYVYWMQETVFQLQRVRNLFTIPKERSCTGRALRILRVPGTALLLRGGKA